MTPDYYELHLLGLAVEALPPGHELTIRLAEYSAGWVAMVWARNTRKARGVGPTLAEALAALLDDLGVEYPERPSAENLAGLPFEIGLATGLRDDGDVFAVLRDLYAREPLTVLALLGGEG